MEEKEGRVYELGYVLVPTLELDTVGEMVTKIKKSISDKSGTLVSEGAPNLMNLSYEMSRTIDNKKTWFNTGYFGWIKFEMSAEDVVAFEASLKLDEKIIRYMIIKTVKESTLAGKKVFRSEGAVTKKSVSHKDVAPAVVVEETPMTKEDMDKEIEALVVEDVAI